MSTSIIGTFIIGGAFFLFGILSIKKGIDQKRVCQESTIGEIVDIKISRRPRKKGSYTTSNYYTPIYSYMANGTSYSLVGARAGKYSNKVGDNVELYYSAEAPGTAYVKGASGIGKGIALAAVGVFFIAAGIFLMLIQAN